MATALRSGHLAQGREVRAFEEEMAARFGARGSDAVAVASGTAALYLALLALSARSGARVLMPTYVCTALLHATRLAGAEPVIADVRDSDFNLDPARAPFESDVVLLPHTYGVPADPDAYAGLGRVVVEDCAQAIGATFHGRSVGSLGRLAVFSFYATKPLTAGQGGMVIGDKPLCQDVRDRRDYDGKHELRERFNFQMTEFQAALGRAQLRRFDTLLARRREAAELYSEALPAGIRRQEPMAGAQPNHFRFVLRLGRAEEARQRFAAQRIATIVPTESWELLHRQLGLRAQDFPVAETVARSTLSVPIQPALTDGERSRVAAVLRTLADLA